MYVLLKKLVSYSITSTNQEAKGWRPIYLKVPLSKSYFNEHYFSIKNLGNQYLLNKAVF